MGTHRETGERVEGLDDVHQSVSEILGTPTRSRPMRPEYGVNHLELVDSPMNPAGRARVFAASVDALRTYEPRIRVKRAQLGAGGDGVTEVEIHGETDGQDVVARRLPAAIDEGRRLLYPTARFDLDSFDHDLQAWEPGFGSWEAFDDSVGGSLEWTAKGARLDGAQMAKALESATPPALAAAVLSPAVDWTIAVAYRIDTEAGTQDPVSVQPLAATGIPWITHRWTIGAPFLTVEEYTPAGSSTMVLQDSDSDLKVLIIWHRRDSGEGPVVGAEMEPDTDGTSELAFDTYDDSPMDGFDPGITLGAHLDGSTITNPSASDVARVQVWPRVLTRRERIAVRAEYRRELEL